MADRAARYVVEDEYPFPPIADDTCPKCGADMDDGECEECERAAPLDFDT